MLLYVTIFSTGETEFQPFIMRDKKKLGAVIQAVQSKAHKFN